MRRIIIDIYPNNKRKGHFDLLSNSGEQQLNKEDLTRAQVYKIVHAEVKYALNDVGD